MTPRPGRATPYDKTITAAPGSPRRYAEAIDVHAPQSPPHPRGPPPGGRDQALVPTVRRLKAAAISARVYSLCGASKIASPLPASTTSP